MTDLRPYEAKMFSQNGEDGITLFLLDLVYGTKQGEGKSYVEFGVESGTECNTRILREYFGWTGLMMDGRFENQSINLQKEFITRENILDLFSKYNVPSHVHLLSVDIDYNDFYVLHEILKAHTADIIICEYNASHLSHEDKIVVYKPDGCWDQTNYYGTSLLALTRMLKTHGFTLVYCNANGVNAFFVSDKVISERNLDLMCMGDVDRLYKPAQYGLGPRGGHTQDHLNRPFVSSSEVL